VRLSGGAPLACSCRIHGDDEFRFNGKSALEKRLSGSCRRTLSSVSGWQTGKALDNFNNELWMIAEDVRVIFQDRWADPRIDQTGACELVDERRGVVLGREGRELQNAGVKDDSEGKVWLVATPVRVARFRRTQPPRLRSCFSRGSGSALAPAPGTA
jgi:hypothetical protein